LTYFLFIVYLSFFDVFSSAVEKCPEKIIFHQVFIYGFFIVMSLSPQELARLQKLACIKLSAEEQAKF